MSVKAKIKSPKRKRLTVFFILLGVVIAAASIATYLIINAQAKPVAFDDEEALYSTRYLETPTDGSNPTNYNAEDNIAIALYTTEHQNNFKTITQGSSDAGVAVVSVNDYRVVIGDEAITATVSDGIVSFGKMKYFNKEKEVALLREVKTIKDGKALAWSDDTPACVSFKTYKQMYGYFPFGVSGYIICPETILSSEFVTNDDGTFTVKLKLNPDGDYAPYYYRRTVAANGSSSMVPEFEFINLDFTFSSDWKILYVRSNEKYLVKSMGIKAASETDCTETFTYDDVSFNQPDYDYFMQYKDLKPSDITPQTKTDILTLLVESLMNGGEPRTFNFTIKEKDNIITGLASVDLKSAEEVAVKAKIGDLFFEFKDNMLYLALGDELKIKVSPDQIGAMASGLLSSDSQEGLDPKEIIAQINSGTIEVKSTTEMEINTSFEALGMTFPIHMIIITNGDGNVILENLDLSLNYNGTPITIAAAPSGILIDDVNHDEFYELSDASYVFDYVTEIIKNGKANIKANLEYNGLIGVVDAKASFSDSIELFADVEIRYKEKSINLSLAYQNDTLYLDLYNIRLKIKKDDILPLVMNYSSMSTIDLALSGASILDLDNIIRIIMSIDFNRLFSDFGITKDGTISLSIGLDQFKEDLKTIIAEVKNESGITANIKYEDINVSATVNSLETFELNINDDEYSNLAYAEPYLDTVMMSINKKVIQASLTGSYESLNLSAIVNADFRNSIKAKAYITLSDQTHSQRIDVAYIDDVIYIDFAKKKLMISVSDLKKMLGGAGVDTSTIEDSMSLDDILIVIFSIDYSKLIKSLTIEKDLMNISIDASDYLESLSDLNIILSHYGKHGIQFETSLYNLNGFVIPVDDLDISVSGDYENLSNLKFIMDETLEIIDTKSIEFRLSGSYENINLTGTGYLTFLNDISVDLNFNVSKGNNEKSMRIVYLNDSIYIDFEGLKLSISLNDLMSLLGGAGIDALSTPEVSVGSIINTILSIDYEKLISKLELDTNKLSIGLDLSEFLEGLDDLSLIIEKSDEGLTLNVNMFDIKADIKSVEHRDITLSDDYENLAYLGYVIDNVLSIVNKGGLKASLSAKYESLTINVNALVHFKDSLGLSLDLTLSNGTHSKNIKLTYINDTIYVSFDNLNLTITISDLLALISEFGIDANISFSEDASVEDIIDIILSLDYSKIISELEINESNLNISLNLEDFIQELNELKIIINDREQGLSLSLNLFDIEGEIIPSDELVTIPDGEFENLNYLKFIIDDIKEILETKKLNALISLKYQEFNVSIDASLDFTDTSCLKAKAVITVKYNNSSIDLTIYYIDNTIYLDMFGEKLSIKVDSLISYIKKFLGEGTELNIEVPDSLDDIIDTILSINFSKIIKEFKLLEGKTTITLDLSDYIDSLSSITLIIEDKEEGIDLSVDMYDIKISIDSDDSIAIENSGEYQELENVEFLVDFIKSVLDKKALTLNVNLEVEGISITGDLYLDFNDLNNLILTADLTATYNNKSQNIKVIFKNNIIYLEFGSKKISVELDTLLEYVNKFMSEPIELDSGIDTTSIIDLIFSTDFDSVIKSLVINNNSLETSLDLSTFLDGFDDLVVSISKNESGIKLSLNKYSISASINAIDPIEVQLSGEYQRLENIDFLVDFIKDVLDKKALNLAISLEIYDIEISGNIYLDFNNEIIVKADLTASYNNKSQNIKLIFKDNTIYLEFASKKISIKLDTLLKYVNKFLDTESQISLDSSLEINDILDIIFGLDIEKLLTSLVTSNGSLSLGLDLSEFLDGFDDLLVTISKKESGISISINKYSISASINAVDPIDVLIEGEYQRLENISFLIEFIKAVLYKKAVTININLEVEGILVAGDLYLDFSDLDNLVLRADLTASYNNKSQNIKIIFKDGTIYIDFAGKKLSIELDSLISYINKFMSEPISLDSNIDTTSIIDLIFSTDFDSVIKSLVINNNSLETSLDLFGFLDGFDDLVVSISKNESGIMLSLNKYSISASINAVDPIDVLIEGEYQQLENIEFLVDFIKDVLDKKALNLAVSLEIYDIEICGNIYLDFNNEIIVKADLTASYNNKSQNIILIFKNNTIYIDFAGKKLSIELDTLLSYINKFMSEPIDLSADVDTTSIIDIIFGIDFDGLIKSLVINNNSLETSLDLSKFLDGFDDLVVSISKSQTGISLTLNKYSVSLIVDAVDQIDILPSGEYQRLENLEFIVDFIKTVLDKKAVTLAVNLEVEGISISGDLYLDFNNEIIVKADLTASYNSKSQSIKLIFKNNTIYIDFAGKKLSIELDTLLSYINKFLDTESQISLDSSMEINDILDTIFGLDIKSLLTSLVTSNGSLSLGLDLSEFLDGFDDLNISISKKESGISISINKYSISLLVNAVDPIDVLVEGEYQNLENLNFLVDFIKNVLDKKALNLAVSFEIYDIEISGDIYLDFNNEIIVKADLTASYNNKSQNIKVIFKDNTIYLEFGSKKISVELDTLLKYVNKFLDEESKISLDSSMDLNDILDTIFGLDINKLLTSLVTSNGSLSLALDLSKFLSEFNDILLEVTKTNTGLALTLNKYSISATVDAVDQIDILPSGEYQRLENLEFLVDFIKDVLDKKAVTLNVNLEVEGILVTGDLYLDFNDLDNLTLTADLTASYNSKSQSIKLIFKNNTIYIDFAGKKLSIELDTLLSYFNKFMSEPIDLSADVDTTSIIDIIFGIDFEAIIKSLVLNNNSLETSLDLSTFLDGFDDLNISISKKESGILLSLNKYSISASINAVDPIDVLIEGEYQQLENIEFLVDFIKDVLDSKKIKAQLSLSIDDISASGYAIVDFNDSSNIKVMADLDVSYKTNEFNIKVWFYQSHENLENVIYLSLYGINGYITLDDITSRLDMNSSSSIDIIDEIFNLDFSKVLNSLTINESSLGVNLDLSDYNDDLKDILDLTTPLDLLITNNISYINVSSSKLFNLSLNVFESCSEEVELDNVTYVNLSYLYNQVMDIVDMIGEKSFEIDLSGVLNTSKIIDFDLINIDFNITAKAYFILNNENKYDIEVILNLSNSDIMAEIKLFLVDSHLYVSLGGINVMLDLNNLDQFIDDLYSTFGLTRGSNDELISKLCDLIKTISLTNESDMSLNLDSLYSKLGLLSLLVGDLLDENITINLKNDISETILNLTVSIKESNHALSSLPTDCTTEDDIVYLIERIKEIVDLIKTGNFKLSLSPLEYYKEKASLYPDFKFFGSLIVNGGDRFDTLKFKIELTVQEYRDGHLVCTHYINVTYYENMFYMTYSNGDSPSDYLNFRSDRDNILGIIATVEKIMDIDLESFIGEYVRFIDYLNPELEYVDMTQLKNFIKSMMSSDSSGESDAINLNELFNKFKITENNTTLLMNGNVLIADEFSGDYTKIQMTKVGSNEYSTFSIDKVYFGYSEGDYKTIKNLSITFDNAESIVAPIFYSYYDLNEIGDLIDGIAVAGSYKDFQIEGTIKLTAISIINLDIPIQAYVHNDSDGKPVVFVHMSVPRVGLLITTLVEKKDVYILYKDGYIYINRVDNDGDVQRIKILTETFFDDISYYLMDFALGLPNSILELMTGDSGEEEYKYVNAKDALVNYAYSESSGIKSFSITLNMGEIAANDTLENLSLKINLKQINVDDLGHKAYTIYSISDISFKMAKVITISGGLTLTNVTEEDGFRTIILNAQELPEYITSYIGSNFTLASGSEYKVDVIYNGSGTEKGKVEHKIFFHQGNGTDLSGVSLETLTKTAKAEDTFTVITPTTNICIINGHKYYFAGWYTSPSKKDGTELTNNTMGNTNIHLYAKWIRMYDYTVVDPLGDGYYSYYRTGESTSSYTIDPSKGTWIGYYDMTSNTLITSDYTLPSQIIGSKDLLISAVWDDTYYLVLDNETKYVFKNDPSNTDMVQGLTSQYYSVLKNGIYYSYDKEAFTPKFIFTNYSLDIVDEVINGVTSHYFYIYSYSALRDGYTEYSFSYDSSKYVDINGNRSYKYIQMLNGETFNSSALPSLYYSIYEISSWMDSKHNYHTNRVSENIEEVTFTGYISTRSSYFNYSGASITGLNQNVSILITPIYAPDGTKITSIASSAFTGNNSITSAYISDGITSIGQDAFKNCQKLTEVYISPTVISIATDAFYYSESVVAGQKSKYAEALHIYFMYDQSRPVQFDYSGDALLAYKVIWFNPEKYYGNELPDNLTSVSGYLIDKILELKI